MPRPAKFTRSQLQAAAVAIVDEHGLSALSMRSLAEAIGTGPMTIYNYVKNREELDALVVEAAMSEAQWPHASGDDWQQNVRAICQPIWQAITAHPNAIPLIINRRSLDETALEPIELLIHALAGSGRTGRQLLAAYRTVFGFVIGLAQAQLVNPRPGPAEDPPDPTVARMQALPSDRFPKLIEVATAASQVMPEDEFRAGLDIILAGLAAQTAQVEATDLRPGTTK